VAVYDFSVSGTIEVDSDSLGLAVANSIRTQPNGGGEIAVGVGMAFRLDPAKALEVLLQSGLLRAFQDRFQLSDVAYEVKDISAHATSVQPD
jgi:hypothetical protein